MIESVEYEEKKYKTTKNQYDNEERKELNIRKKNHVPFNGLLKHSAVFALLLLIWY